jgi:hypothetical protein
MAMSEEELLTIVPDQWPDVLAACPKCKAYMRTMKKGWSPESTTWIGIHGYL